MRLRYISVLLLLLVSFGCTKSDEPQPLVPASSEASAEFDVSVVEGILWDTPLTRGAMAAADTVQIDSLYLATAQCGGMASYQAFDSIPLTRGTPVANAKELKNMGIAIFNSEELDFTGATPLWKNIQATNNGGSWQNSQPIIWPSGTAKLSFLAYSPTVGAASGTALSANGRTITYTAPADVTKQPDLCVATPIFNRANPDKSGGHLVNFAMQHSLVAIGIKASGNKVKIKSVVFLGIASTGVLNLENRAWSGVGSKQSFSVKVKEALESVPITDMMVSDGYLMVPPQTLGDDAVMTLVFDDLATGKTNITKSIRLNTFASLKQWQAGQLVYYTIQLKANFPLTLTPMAATLQAPAGTGELSYTTTSPIKITAATNVAWIKNVAVNTSTKKITYSYDALSSGGDRVGKIAVTTGYTKVEATLTQQKPYLTLSTAIPGEMIPMTGKSYKITVSSNMSWKATGSNATVSPASGAAGTTEVTIIVGAYSGAGNRAISANFATDAGGVTQKWSGTQTGETLTIDKTGPGEIVTSYSKTYWIKVTSNVAWVAKNNLVNTTVSPSKGTAGTTDVSIRVWENPTASSRTVQAVFVTASNLISRTWSGTQREAEYVNLDKTGPGEMIPDAGKSYLVKVTSNVPWSASGYNFSANPSNGPAGTTSVTITVHANPEKYIRDIEVYFFKTLWKGKQLDNSVYPTMLTGTGVKANVYVAKEDDIRVSWDEAKRKCEARNQRMPNVDELGALLAKPRIYGGFYSDDYYWSSNEKGSNDAIVYWYNSDMEGGVLLDDPYDKSNRLYCRCVKDIAP